MKQNWLEIFRNNYYDCLMPTGGTAKRAAKRGLVEGLFQRADGFNLMFADLLQTARDQYHIIETGTLRNPGNWKDGQSAVLFTEFVKHQGGWVRSVDIDPAACASAQAAIACDQFTVTCSDSVTWLKTQTDLDQVDLFYLDSWDVKWHNDHDSAEHHLKEFLAIEPHLKSGCIVAIDDNSRFLESNNRTGKGRRVVEYLESKGRLPVYDAYQIIYKF